MEYCPYKRDTADYQQYQDANSLIESNEFNGKSDPHRVQRYINKYTSKTLDEWKIDQCVDISDGYYCTCGHTIHTMYIMKNSITNYMIISGSDCIGKFGDKRLRSEVNRAQLKRYIENNMKIPIRMKYIKDVSNPKNIRYLFQVRKSTNFYKILSEYDTSDTSYSPWYFTKDKKCLVTVIYKYPKVYNPNEWIDMNLSYREYDISGSKVLTFYYRS